MCKASPICVEGLEALSVAPSPWGNPIMLSGNQQNAPFDSFLCTIAYIIHPVEYLYPFWGD